MAQTSRVAVQFDITSSAEKVYGAFKNMGILVQAIPEHIKSYEFVQGNEFGNGAVTIWNYYLGTPMMVKLRHDTNDAAKTVTFTVLGGDILKNFKSFVAKLQFERGFVKWTVELEKLNPGVPNPDEHLELFRNVTKALDNA